MPVMKHRSQLLTRFRFVRNCGLKQQFLDISRQIGPSLEYCTAQQIFWSSHHHVSYTSVAAQRRRDWFISEIGRALTQQMRPGVMVCRELSARIRRCRHARCQA